ncbi:MAG: ribosome biogenesis GTP-binding protein YihA/YsxC [Cyanobacteria bacterium REEB65]|nr:ribosome biogenesis GTP-binding protein YihA/YsxC [Cyanobacteria bacterium REEB65]
MNIHKADYFSAGHGRKDFPRSGLPEIVIVGRSNAGKSSVINALTHRKKLARTGQTPGVTTAIHFFLINDAFLLVDLPGYGFARVSQGERERWKTLIDGYLTERAVIRLAIVVMDARRFPDDLDQLMLDWLRAQQLPFVVLANKADKLGNAERQNARQTLEKALALSPADLVLFSAHSGMNLRPLLSRIGACLALQSTAGHGTDTEHS